MKKTILFIGLILNWAIAIAVGFALNNPGDVVNGTKYATPGLSPDKELKDQLLTVPVYIKNPNSDIGQCTGTLISKKSVLTAKHCFEQLVPASQLVKSSETIFLNSDEVEIVVYSPLALNDRAQELFGKVYKFMPFDVFKEFVKFHITEECDSAEECDSVEEDPDSFVPAENYQRISISKINTLRGKTDMVLLTLRSIPEIFDQGIDPKKEVTFSNYKKYFISVAEPTSDIFSSPLPLVKELEFMGFGSTFTDANVSDELLEKVKLNLRSNSPSIPVFMRHQESDGFCMKDCFSYSFLNQCSDSGDSGAAFSYIQPTASGSKNIIGTVYGHYVFELDGGGSRCLTVIQGINQRDASMINALRINADLGF